MQMDAHTVDGMLFSTNSNNDSVVPSLREDAAAHVASLYATCFTVSLADYLRGEPASIVGGARMEVCLNIVAGSAEPTDGNLSGDGGKETRRSTHMESMVEALGADMWMLNVSIAQAQNSYEVRTLTVLSTALSRPHLCMQCAEHVSFSKPSMSPHSTPAVLTAHLTCSTSHGKALWRSFPLTSASWLTPTRRRRKAQRAP